MTLEDYLRTSGQSLPEGSALAFGVSFVAGVLASAVCPCTLPVGLGMAGVVSSSESQSRKAGFLIALAFFAGIVANLTLLGAVAGRLGAILTESFGRYWALAMALVSLVAAVFAFRGPRLEVTRLAAMRKSGLLGTFGYGFIFSLGTSAAPLLLLLTVAATQARPGYGAALAFTFGLGRGLPFLLVGVFAGALVRLTRVGLWRRAIQAVSGTALLFVSAYYFRAYLALV